MKIAFIGQKGIGDLERGGGIEKHVTELAVRLVKKGHEVFVYARRRYCPTHPTFRGVNLICLPTVYRKNIETILHTWFSTFHALFQDYDVIHFHGVGPATLAWLPRLFKPKTRVIVTFHSQDQYHQKWGWLARHYLQFGEWASVHFPHVCITVSHVLQVYCRNRFRRQVVYIPNGAEMTEVHSVEALKTFGVEPNEYVLFVGRIVPQKGLHFLISAFKQLHTIKKLVIVGAPSFSDRYMNELKRLAGADPSIIFTGQLNGEALHELFAQAYLYVQPSESEGLPVAVLEAMSYGTAVLVSDIPENLEAIQNTGFSFVNSDIPDLTARLRKLLSETDSVAAMGKRGKAMVAEHFNWDKITDKVEEVYVTARH